jgi:hypothetical protein
MYAKGMDMGPIVPTNLILSSFPAEGGDEHAEISNKQATIKTDKSNLNLYIKPPCPLRNTTSPL